jgi:hypothetical protein
LQKTQGQGTLEPNFRPPFEHISHPQIPLTRLKEALSVASRRIRADWFEAQAHSATDHLLA